MTPGARWLDTLWPQIRPRLPAAPAHVVEVGCGSLGGFVPMLRADGYDAVVIEADPAQVIDRITNTLTRGGALVVVEWAWERLDEQTAAWCFKRLGPDDKAGWLHRRRDEWLASGHDWPSYLRDWAGRDRLHPGEVLLRLLDERLERQLLTHGLTSFPISSARLRPTSRPRSTLARSNRRAATT